ncbi:unnamed protein product [Urochloa humidicola]
MVIVSPGVFCSSPVACRTARWSSLWCSGVFNKAANRRFVSLRGFSGGRRGGYEVGGSTPGAGDSYYIPDDFAGMGCGRFVHAPASVKSLLGIFCFPFAPCGSVVQWLLMGGGSTAVSFAGFLMAMMIFFVFILCVVGQICLVLPCAACVLPPGDAAGLDSAAGNERKTFVYQHEKSGWFLPTTISGGSSTPRGPSSLGLWGGPVLEASDSSMTRRSDGRRPSTIAGSFSVQRACRFRYAAQDGVKQLRSSPERRSVSSGALRQPVARTTGKASQGLACILSSFEGVLVKGCNHQN